LISYLKLAAFTVVVALVSGCSRDADKASTPSQADSSTKTPAANTELARKPTVRWAEQLYKQQQYDKAIEEATAVMLADPDNGHAISIMAESYYAKGDITSAIATARSIPEKELVHGPALRSKLADWLIEDGAWDEAEDVLLSLQKTDPKSDSINRQLIKLYNLCGRRYEGNFLTQTLLHDGSANRDFLLLLLDPAEPLDTRELAKAALQKHPDQVLPKLAMANYDILLQDYDSAAARLTEIVKSNRVIPSAFANLALVYSRTAQWSQLNELLARLPNGADAFPNTWIAAGMLRSSQGNDDEAIACHVRALDVFSMEPEALQEATRLLFANGHTEAANETSNRLKAAALIRERLKVLSINNDDKERMRQLSQDLQVFERYQEAYSWLVLSYTQTPTDAGELDRSEALRKVALSEPVDLGKLWPSIAAWKAKPITLSSSSATTASVTSNSPDVQQGQIKFRSIESDIDAKFQYEVGPLTNGGYNLYQTTMGPGVGVIDYDLDGWPDLYLPQAAARPLEAALERINRFFRNVDGLKAIDVHTETRLFNWDWGQGVAVGDFNADGFQDIFVCALGKNLLWENNGEGTFSIHPYPVQPADRNLMSVSAAFGDVNGDTLPDIVEANYADLRTVMSKSCTDNSGAVRTCSPTEFRPSKDRILINDGQGGFSEVNEVWNSPIDTGRGLGLLIGNFDKQHGNDVYIANDMNANHLLVSYPSPNTATGSTYQLRDEAALRGVAVDSQGRAQASMGIASGDMNRDGWLDIFITNFLDEYNVVYLGQKGGTFIDATARQGMAYKNKQTLGFGTQAVDFDKDGFLDLAILNGHVDDFRSEGKSFAMKPEVFRGTKAGFVAVADSELGSYFQEERLGRVLVTIDWDRDMNLDFVATHIDRELSVLRNESVSNNHNVQFELVGTSSERDATGAYVEVTCGSDKWTASVVKGSGFECSNESVIDIGVGGHTKIDTVSITWPSGHKQQFDSLAVDDRYLVIENENTPVSRNP
jgi:hypothetical protein